MSILKPSDFFIQDCALTPSLPISWYILSFWWGTSSNKFMRGTA